MRDGTGRLSGYGFHGDRRGRRRRTRNADTRAAVTEQEDKLTSEELADRVEGIVYAVRARIMGPGAAQYDDGSGVQKFERLTMPELATWLIEEADDLIVYAAMLRIRAERFAAECDQARTLDP